jgi:hypothetical protein
LDRLVRNGFDTVIGRMDAMTERLERLEAEVAALRPSTTKPAAPRPPLGSPSVASQRPSTPEPAGPPTAHIDETLVWGDPEDARPETDRPTKAAASASVPERFAADLGEHGGSEGSGLGRILRRRRPEQEPTS